MSTERDEAVVRMIELHLLSLGEMLPGLELTLIARRPSDPEAFVILGGEDLEALEAVLARAKARRMQ
jgi:hypothetical protein